jgi:hypothetical protein
LLALLPALLFATGFFRRGELRALQSMFPQTRTT